ncbi:MAG: insulinase family protein [Chloracidobacterium sp.]|nr:insulinase family protein [Chloracidobacterium sp.]
MILAFRNIVICTFLVTIVLSSVFFSQTTLPAPKQEKLLNGLRVLMWQDAKAEQVWVTIRVHSGSAFDPQGKEGLMQMLSDNLFPNEASREFFREDLEGDLKITTTYDYIQIDAMSKPDSLLTMLETVATAISNPVIDKETTTKLRADLLAKITGMEADPAYLADRAVAKRLLGTFPYGRPQNGTVDSLKKIDFGDLIDAKTRFVTADNATLTISGNFDRAAGFRAVRRYFGGWLKSDKKVPATFRQPDAPPAGVQIIASPKAEVTAVRFAIRGTSRGSKDFAASSVFAAILESRLKARVPEAFASRVFVRNEIYLLPGVITIGFSAGKDDLGTGNGKVDANDLIAKALSDAVTDAEFQSAKTVSVATWNTRTAPLFWLDNDTYKTTSIETDRLVFNNLALADVRAYADTVKGSPMASVLVNTPPAKN